MIKNNTKPSALKPTVIIEGKFIRFARLGSWEYVERNNCCGIVIIVPITDEGQVILIEQYRIPVGKNVIEFPAGLVNDIDPKKKESILSAARRELIEETGYRAGKMTKIMDGPVSSGFTSDIATILMATGLHKVASGGGDPTESIAVHAVAYKKVDTWLSQKQKKGCLVDPKIYAGLYWLKKYNGLN